MHTNNTIITSDQEEEINVVQNTPENVQVTNVPAVTTAASSGLDRQRPVWSYKIHFRQIFGVHGLLMTKHLML
jgi:hypothetical protein